MTRRLLVSYLVITVIVLIVLEVPLGIVYKDREQERLAGAAERDATVLATYYEDTLESGVADEDGVEGLGSLAQDYADRTSTRVVVVDAAGISIVDTAADVATDRDFSTRAEIRQALSGERASFTRTSETLGYELLVVAVPVASSGTVWGAVRITIDAHEVTERVYQFWLGLAGVGAVIVLAMTAIGWAIARSVTRPVRELQAAAVRFADGDLEAVAPAHGAPPELRQLQATLNTMAGRIDGMLTRQRDFVADASHQLRSPLTALRLRLENLLSGLDAGADRDDVEAAIAETDRLTALVSDLLTLARAERSANPGPVELVALVRDRGDTWSAVAEVGSVDIVVATPRDQLWALAVPGGVEQILDNLIDNALAASPEGAVVTVTVTAGPSGHELAVADQGPGLDHGQKARALDRFWRGRSDHPGTGLGLPIAAALAAASGGSLRLGDVSPTGLVVTVVLPPAPGGGAEVGRWTATPVASPG